MSRTSRQSARVARSRWSFRGAQSGRVHRGRLHDDRVYRWWLFWHRDTFWGTLMRHSTDNLGPKSLLAPSVIEPSLPGQLVCSARPCRRLPACGLGTAGLAVDLPTIAGGADHHLLVAEGARVDPVSILNRRRHCLTPGLDSRGDSGHTPLGSSDLNRRENPKRPKVCNNARVSFLFPAKGSSTPPSKTRRSCRA